MLSIAASLEIIYNTNTVPGTLINSTVYYPIITRDFSFFVPLSINESYQAEQSVMYLCINLSMLRPFLVGKSN